MNITMGLQGVTVSAAELRSQAELFDRVDVGCELLSIEEDRAANKHTGSTLERREALRNEICERLCQGVSIRQVCREFAPLGRNTVAALVRRLEASGKMEPYKKRMSAKMGQLVEMGTDLLLERAETGDIPTNVLPVMVGIFSDKKALIDGEPTTILEKRGNEEFSQAAYDRWLADLKRVKEVPATVSIDAQSTGDGGKPE